MKTHRNTASWTCILFPHSSPEILAHPTRCKVATVPPKYPLRFTPPFLSHILSHAAMLDGEIAPSDSTPPVWHKNFSTCFISQRRRAAWSLCSLCHIVSASPNLLQLEDPQRFCRCCGISLPAHYCAYCTWFRPPIFALEEGGYNASTHPHKS